MGRLLPVSAASASADSGGLQSSDGPGAETFDAGRYAGRFDGINDGLIFGWAVSRQQPDVSTLLRVHVDGVFVSEIGCDGLRADLAPLGLMNKPVGFSYRLPERFQDNRPHTVSILLPGDLPLCAHDSAGRVVTELTYMDPVPKQVVGFVDGLTGDIITGWAVRKDVTSGVMEGGVRLLVLCDDVVVCEITADQLRADVAHSLKCSPEVGFAFELPSQCRNGQEFKFTFKALPQGYQLSNSPATIRYRTQQWSSNVEIVQHTSPSSGPAEPHHPAFSSTSVFLYDEAGRPRASRGGFVDILSSDRARAQQGYEIWSGEIFKGLLRPLEQQNLDLRNINRIQDGLFRGGSVPWMIDGNTTGVVLSRNSSDEWTLAGCGTAFMSLEQPGARISAIYHDPLAGTALPALAGEHYAFGGYFGLHRAHGQIGIEFLDKEARQIGQAVTPLQAIKPGGRSLDDYEVACASGRAPATAASLRLRVSLRCDAAAATAGFIFMTNLYLVRGREPGPRLTTPDAPFAAALFTAADPQPFVLTCALPQSQLSSDNDQTSRIIERASGLTLAPGEITWSTRSKTVLRDLRLEGTSLVAESDGDDSPGEGGSLVFFVDGLPDPRVIVPEFYARAGFRLSLPPHLLDGRGHVFQLFTQTGRVLGSVGAFVPAQLTPWDALRRYVGLPLPISESPAAADRYRSLVASLQASSVEEQHQHLNQLVIVHDILVEGFEFRQRYPRLVFPTVRQPDVSVVIPAHNKFSVTYHCLAGLLLAHNKASFEVIVVDDASSDETRHIEELISGIKVVRNDPGLGFLRGCNRGADEAAGRYIVMLNNDTEPTAAWLDELIFVFENFEGVGLAGSKLIYPDGRLQEAGGIIWATGSPWNYGRGGNERDPRYNYTRQVDYVSGAAMMLRTELWRSLGGFTDEFAPAYFEDTDLAFKVREAGYKVVFVPLSRVYHYEGMSSGTDPASGAKRFQEVNRPKFKRRWHRFYRLNGKEGVDVEKIKDRGVIGRALFIDAETPRLDMDAGSYAALQEIRAVQGLGYKVTFLGSNMAYLGRHTNYLQRLGVEMAYAPFYYTMQDFLEQRAAEFDLIYITRYNVSSQVTSLIRRLNPHAKIALCLADLHFLRATREALVRGEGPDTFASIRRQRDDELAALREVDLGLSYSATEIAVIESHNGPDSRVIRLPWIIDMQERIPPYETRKDIAFLGGFRHMPNVDAVEFFAKEVMPLLVCRLPGARFLIYGSNMPASFSKLESETVVLKGFVREVSEVFDNCRVFVAPLRFGAGIKGKVLDSIAAGTPAVLSPIALEGIPLCDETSVLVARTPAEWADAVHALYSDESLWAKLSAAIRTVGAKEFSFEKGRAAMGDIFHELDLPIIDSSEAMVATRARPRDLG